MGDDYVTKIQRLLDAEKGVALTGSALNFIVIIYIFIKRRYKTSFSRAYLNMAIADFLYASSSLLFQLHPGFQVQSHLGCQINILLINILTIADLLSIVPITTDRFVAVLLPIRYKQKSHVITMATITMLCWITPMLIESARAIYHSRITEDGSFVKIVNNMCQINGRDPLSKKLNTVKHFLAMPLPLLYSTTSYGIIIHKLSRNNSHQRWHFTKAQLNLIICVVKAILTTLIFTASWSPVFLISNGIVGYDTQESLDIAFQKAEILLLLNTLSDPLIYLVPNDVIIKIIARAGLGHGHRPPTEGTSSAFVMDNIHKTSNVTMHAANTS